MRAAVSDREAGRSQAGATPCQWGRVSFLLSDSSFRLQKEGGPEQGRGRARSHLQPAVSSHLFSKEEARARC